LNAHLHIPRVIPVIFHYNQIKTTFLSFHGYDGNGGHFKIFYHKCTTTHPKNIHMKFHYNRTKTFFYLSWLPWQSSLVTVNMIIIINRVKTISLQILLGRLNNNIIIIIKIIVNGVKTIILLSFVWKTYLTLPPVRNLICRFTGVNVMSVTAVSDIPRWRMRIQVRINIIVFVKIMDYSSVFHVLIDVS
jgi:hypothetical protein